MPQRLHPVLLATAALASCYLIYLGRQGRGEYQGRQLGAIDDIFNRTLGFQRIYAIGLPERTDKRDALSLAASLTGIDLEWTDGVRPENVSPKAAPPGWDYSSTMEQGHLGCWRGHMDAMQKIVKDNIQSALILEDDADWDVFLKYQLAQFAIGTQSLQHSQSMILSPYGNDWELLWLGHARISMTNERQEVYFLKEDLTVPPFAKRHSSWKQTHVPADLKLNNTRIIIKNSGAIGTVGIAVTLQGARRVLSALSIGTFSRPVDEGYKQMCRGSRSPGLTCYGPWPPLINPHRAAGPQSRHSDTSNRSMDWVDESTYDTVYSTMINIPRLLDGHKSVISQWPNLVDSPELPLTYVPKSDGQLRVVELGKQEEEYVQNINHSWRPQTDVAI